MTCKRPTQPTSPLPLCSFLPFAVFFLAATLVVPGCNAKQIEALKVSVGLASRRVDDAKQAVDLVAASVTAIEQDVADAKKRVEATPDGPEREKALKSLAIVEQALTAARQGHAIVAGRLVALQTSLANAEKKLATAEDGPGAALALGEEVAPWIPAPWGAIGLSLLSAAVPLWRAIANGKAKVKAEARATAGEMAVIGVEVGKDADGKIDFNDAVTADLVRDTQGAEGRAFVKSTLAKAINTEGADRADCAVKTADGRVFLVTKGDGK